MGKEKFIKRIKDSVTGYFDALTEPWQITHVKEQQAVTAGIGQERIDVSEDDVEIRQRTIEAQLAHEWSAEAERIRMGF